MSKFIEVTVSPKGEIKIETKGFTGASCRDASRALEQALGVRESEEPTAEYHAPVVAEQQQQRQ